MFERIGPAFALAWATASEAVARSRGDHWLMTDEQLKGLGAATVECLVYYGGGPLAKHAPLVALSVALMNWVVPAAVTDVQLAKERELARQREAADAQRPAQPARYTDEPTNEEEGRQ